MLGNDIKTNEAGDRQNGGVALSSHENQRYPLLEMPFEQRPEVAVPGGKIMMPEGTAEAEPREGSYWKEKKARVTGAEDGDSGRR